MDRRDLLLAILASSEGRPFTPVQIQKAVFLVTRNQPGVVDDGPQFEFVPYDYGPFDVSVYNESDELRRAGDVIIAPSGSGRWNTYAASDTGLTRGRDILARMGPSTREYIVRISDWVRRLSFSDLVKSIYEAYPDMRARSIFQG